MISRIITVLKMIIIHMSQFLGELNFYKLKKRKLRVSYVHPKFFLNHLLLTKQCNKIFTIKYIIEIIEIFLVIYI